MTFGPGRIRTFDLTRVNEADEMIRAINAMKALLKQDDEAAN
jgi:hypothetical protein